METDITNLFYATLQHCLQQEYPGKPIDGSSMQIFRDLSPLMDDSFYVIDIHTHKFVYIAPRLLLLCGCTPVEALAIGYRFYQKVIYPGDLQLFSRIHQVMLEYFLLLLTFLNWNVSSSTSG